MIRSLSWSLAIGLAVLGVVSPDGRADAADKVDRIRLAKGSDAGEVVGATPLDVTLKRATGDTRKIAVNDIRSLQFDGEPSELTQARLLANKGSFAPALDKIKEIDASKMERDLVREDAEFYRALCGAKLALGGNGEIGDAGSRLNEFVRRHPQSFHYLEAVEAMGDLLMASDKFPAAQKQYAELAKAPWPDYQIRAGVLVGRALQAQGQHAEAIRQFDSVLGTSEDSEASRSQRLSATLGKAVSLAATKHEDDAIRMIEEVIQNTDPEQKELQARAYNALGNCYEQAGKNKDALLAFLHVDMLYSTVSDAHAEALSHLVPLWQSVGDEARAREARQVLNERYAGSHWAK